MIVMLPDGRIIFGYRGQYPAATAREFHFFLKDNGLNLPLDEVGQILFKLRFG